MKVLDGLELTGYIKERQLKQVRALRQSWRVVPRLAIICTGDNPAVGKQIQLKCEYGEDIMTEIDVYNVPDFEILKRIELLNRDENIHGIILQLSSGNSTRIDDFSNAIIPEKDVCGLSDKSLFMSTTKMATDWLLVGYNIEETDPAKLNEIIAKATGLEMLETTALFDNVITSARKIADQKGQQDI